MLTVRSHVTFVTSSGGAAVCKYLNKFTNENIVTKYFNAESRAVAWSTDFQHISSLDRFVVLNICVIKTNLMHYLSSVYFVSQPQHVSAIFVAHHQEVYCIYTAIGTCCAVQLTVCWPVPSQLGQQTVNCTAQHVPVAAYVQYTSWWWATNMSETCRGWLTKWTEDKQCIKLVFITRVYRDAQSTKRKIDSEVCTTRVVCDLPQVVQKNSHITPCTVSNKFHVELF
jgi:hypothetical protein